MSKSPDAFRTISEVADWLGVQAHVLRFWESKFAQVKPIKRAGGRRYYRPTDMLLLGGLKKLLHEDGLTIKGAQKLLREQGISFVADQSQPLDDLTMAVMAGTTQSDEADAADMAAAELSLPDLVEEIEDPQVAHADVPEVSPESTQGTTDESTATAPSEGPAEVMTAPEPDAVSESPDHAAPEVPAPKSPADTVKDNEALADAPDTETAAETPEIQEPLSAEAEAPQEEEAHPTPEDNSAAAEGAIPDAPEPDIPQAEDLGQMPSFRARARPAPPTQEAPAKIDLAAASPDEDQPGSAQTALDLAPTEPEALPQSPVENAPPRARQIDVPAVPDPGEIAVDASVLTALSRVRHLSPQQAQDIKPLLARLTRLRASMANPATEHHKD